MGVFYYRLLSDKDFPPQCGGSLRRHLCEHFEERLEPLVLVTLSHLRGDQVSTHNTLPREQFERRGWQRVHGKL